ncbi:hypothetical protein EX30DRAFT_383509 [Ascodesmis nigricans]|uniref:Serine protease n=1 Tax=Ascodesmis nigricans TaxID=341454 RepID=A0A4S2MSH2_9PEZI|nr:hypothetical protein EX30DRAFT_383509 [Ascodesmis nigricans]
MSRIFFPAVLPLQTEISNYHKRRYHCQGAHPNIYEILRTPPDSAVESEKPRSPASSPSFSEKFRQPRTTRLKRAMEIEPPTHGPYADIDDSPRVYSPDVDKAFLDAWDQHSRILEDSLVEDHPEMEFFLAIVGSAIVHTIPRTPPITTPHLAITVPPDTNKDSVRRSIQQGGQGTPLGSLPILISYGKFKFASHENAPRPFSCGISHMLDPYPGASIGLEGARGSGTLGMWLPSRSTTKQQFITNCHVITPTDHLRLQLPQQPVKARNIVCLSDDDAKYHRTPYATLRNQHISAFERDYFKLDAPEKALPRVKKLLEAQQDIWEYDAIVWKSKPRRLGKVVKGWRGVINNPNGRGFWVDVGVVETEGSSGKREPWPREAEYCHLDYDTLPWKMPKANSDVLKIGRTTGATVGKVYSRPGILRMVDPADSSRRIITREWFVSSQTLEPYKFFSRDGDSGSIVVSLAEEAINGIIFAVVEHHGPGLRAAFFTTAPRLARALELLVGTKIAPENPRINFTLTHDLVEMEPVTRTSPAGSVASTVVAELSDEEQEEEEDVEEDREKAGEEDEEQDEDEEMEEQMEEEMEEEMEEKEDTPKDEVNDTDWESAKYSTLLEWPEVRAIVDRQVASFKLEKIKFDTLKESK